MARTPDNIQAELAQRHRIASITVVAMLALVLVLVVIAIVSGQALKRSDLLPPSSPMGLWIAILIFGLGAFALRRTRFSAMRLQDIAALRGLSGLLKSLQGTTMQIAFLGGAIALMGFIVTILTGEKYDMLRAGGVALIVLFYCYPSRGAWQRVVHGIEQRGNANDPSAKGNIT